MPNVPGKAKLEQTKLNLDPEVLEILSRRYAGLLGKALDATDRKLDLLLNEDPQIGIILLAKTSPGQLTTLLRELMCGYALLTGSSTRTLDFDKDELEGLKNGIVTGEQAIELALEKISERIEQRKKERLQLISRENATIEAEVVDEGPEIPSSMGFETMQLDIMRRKGYLDEEGKWTGKVPDDTEPTFIRIRLEKMRTTVE